MSQDVLLTVMNSMSLIGDAMNNDGNRKESFNLEAELLKSQNAFNNLLKSHSHLEKHFISLECSIQLNQEVFQKCESCDNQDALEILEFFENNDLKAQLEDKDSTIYKLKDTMKSLREKSKEENVNYDYGEIETKIMELENSVAKLSSKNERLCNEINHAKQVFKKQFDSIKKMRVRIKEQSDSLIDKLNLKSAENEDFKAQIQDKYLDSGCSKHMIGNRSQLMNLVSKFLGTVRFRNDHIAKTMSTVGSLRPTYVLARRVGFAVKLPSAFALEGQSSPGLRKLCTPLLPLGRPTPHRNFQEAAAPRAMVLADSPVSTSIDQDTSSISAVDPTLFTWKAGNDLLLEQIYVDDIIFTSTNTAMCNEFANLMTTKFKMSMIGQMSFFSGLQISQKKSKLDEVLQGKPVEATFNHGMIKSLMYLKSSRPSLTYAVCLCAWYQAKPTEKHLHAVKRIFRYLEKTINTGLWYSKDTDMSLTAYADAYRMRCQDTRRITSRSDQFLGDKLVSWSSKK
nr:hypothetical protein [Tanacetum cinerariifolium]